MTFNKPVRWGYRLHVRSGARTRLLHWRLIGNVKWSTGLTRVVKFYCRVPGKLTAVGRNTGECSAGTTVFSSSCCASLRVPSPLAAAARLPNHQYVIKPVNLWLTRASELTNILFGYFFSTVVETFYYSLMIYCIVIILIERSIKYYLLVALDKMTKRICKIYTALLNYFFVYM